MLEIWRPVRGYESYYSVSNQGRVKSVERSITIGTSIRVVKERILKPSKNSTNGQQRLTVSLWKNNKGKSFRVHRLVAEAFVDNPELKPCINHIDSDSLNNTSVNLEWVTHKENTTHCIKSGRFKNPPPMMVITPEIRRKLKTF